MGLEFEKQGRTPHIPIEGIWLDIQTRVGTPHILSLENPYGWLGGWVVLSGNIW